ncbi:hypothetical protein [Piscinibacter koreensis]|uniref:Uncharacterized protein n=1 Tax=Piscinibacter koreensis TaxID=2742824 RepID=A0A7Y6NP88_9BURK|nr:hypothetical protein [Schlegelella koreensis]NUZ06727.1 hypothetical protein [Schlegelella koreensis]
MATNKQRTGADGTAPTAAAAINVSAAVQAANLVKETLAALTRRRDELTAEKERLTARNAELWRMPIVGAEALAFVQSSIDMLAAEFVPSIAWSKMLAQFARPSGRRAVDGDTALPLNLADLHMVSGTRRVSGSSAATGLRGVLGVETLGLLAYFSPS